MVKHTRASTAGPPPDNDDDYGAFVLEAEADARRTRYAVLGAVLIHALLFALPLGFLRPERAAAAAPPKKVFVVQEVRFEKRLPEPEPVLPEPERPRVPIPDPTPDDPEPLVPDEEIVPRFDVPDIDIVDVPTAPPPIPDRGPIRFGGDVTRPVRISGPQPRYTEAARIARIEGPVILEAIIDKRGNVLDLSVLKPLPMGLDKAAVEAVSQWKFDPATLNGEPVDVLYNLTVTFRLR